MSSGSEVPRSELVLMTKGKPLPPDLDASTLLELGFKNNQQVVVSRQVGQGKQSNAGGDAKNSSGAGQGEDVGTGGEADKVQ